MMSHEKPIDELVKTIVELVHLLRILLFGSHARNEAGPDSDIDLLIVMPEGIHRRNTAQYLYRQIQGIGIPFDLIVATPQDLEKHRDNSGLIYKNALREGRVLYVA